MRYKFLSLFVTIGTFLWFVPRRVGAIVFSDEPRTFVSECTANDRTLFSSTVEERIDTLILLLAIAFLLGILTVVVINAARKNGASRGLAVVAGLLLVAIPFASNASTAQTALAQICTENVWIPEQLEIVVMAGAGYVAGILVGLLIARFMNKISRMQLDKELRG